jgi:hypothetical protein|tara:strand:+ start:1370 stop:1546 length:177 start_codon:yes stop_codon:yes gene_type:complete
MKNKLELIQELNAAGETQYKVFDRDTLYLITKDKSLAERIYKQFKLEYQAEKQNASKI